MKSLTYDDVTALFTVQLSVKDSENKNTLAETTFEVEKLNVTTEDTAEGRARAEDIRNARKIQSLLGKWVADETITCANEDVYKRQDQGLTYYTYPRLEKLNHYGDWQAEFESGALVYYERYEDETYGFYGANLSTLKTSKFVVGDGYALAYIEKKDATDNVTVTYANDKTIQVLFDSAIETTDDTTNTKYYLYPCLLYTSRCV